MNMECNFYHPTVFALWWLKDISVSCYQGMFALQQCGKWLHFASVVVLVMKWSRSSLGTIILQIKLARFKKRRSTPDGFGILLVMVNFCHIHLCWTMLYSYLSEVWYTDFNRLVFLGDNRSWRNFRTRNKLISHSLGNKWKLGSPNVKEVGEQLWMLKIWDFLSRIRSNTKHWLLSFRFVSYFVDMFVITSIIVSYISGLTFILHACFTGRFFSRMQIWQLREERKLPLLVLMGVERAPFLNWLWVYWSQHKVKLCLGSTMYCQITSSRIRCVSLSSFLLIFGSCFYLVVCYYMI